MRLSGTSHLNPRSSSRSDTERRALLAHYNLDDRAKLFHLRPLFVVERTTRQGCTSSASQHIRPAPGWRPQPRTQRRSWPNTRTTSPPSPIPMSAATGRPSTRSRPHRRGFCRLSDKPPGRSWLRPSGPRWHGRHPVLVGLSHARARRRALYVEIVNRPSANTTTSDKDAIGRFSACIIYSSPIVWVGLRRGALSRGHRLSPGDAPFTSPFITWGYTRWGTPAGRPAR